MVKKARDAQSYWLLKSEPTCYAIGDLRRERRTAWTGVRNYQARNLMRDGMKVGDLALFYHSSAEPTGVAGVAEVVGAARPDLTALDPADDHFDPKATHDGPIWLAVEVGFVAEFPSFVSLAALRADRRLEGMMVLARGSRLSVQPVSREHFLAVCDLGGWKPK